MQSIFLKGDLVGETLSKYLAGVVLFVIYGAVLFGAGYFSGGKANQADNNARVVEVQRAMALLGQVIQKQSAETAEATRDKQIAEKRRIDAINTAGHKTERIGQLEKQLAQIMQQQSAKSTDGKNLQNTDNGRYHIFDSAVIERVWNRASGNDLSTSGAAGAIQTRP